MVFHNSSSNAWAEEISHWAVEIVQTLTKCKNLHTDRGIIAKKKSSLERVCKELSLKSSLFRFNEKGGSLDRLQMPMERICMGIHTAHKISYKSCMRFSPKLSSPLKEFLNPI